MKDMTLHSHNFLSENHSDKEWRTWGVILLCFMAMVIEIICGTIFGSLALVADGIHMSTHVFAFLITACSYSYSRVHADDPRFVFGTGKVGELSSFTCAIILFAISLIIVYEGIYQLIHPVKLDWAPALAVSFVGLTVNVASGFLLMFPCGRQQVGPMDHGHSHGHAAHEFLADFDIEENEHGHDHGQEHENVISPVHAGGGHGGGGHDHGHGHGHDHDETFEVEARNI